MWLAKEAKPTHLQGDTLENPPFGQRVLRLLKPCEDCVFTHTRVLTHTHTHQILWVLKLNLCGLSDCKIPPIQNSSKQDLLLPSSFYVCCTPALPGCPPTCTPSGNFTLSWMRFQTRDPETAANCCRTETQPLS